MPDLLVTEGNDPLDAIVDEILGETEPEKDEPEAEQEEPEDQKETPEEEEAAAEEEQYLEFKYRGQKVKKSLDEVLDLAEKGMGADLKFQEAAEMRKAVESERQYIQQQAQFNEQFRTEIAQITAMDMQIDRYKQVDWAQWTDQDPVEATKGWQRFQLMQQQRGEMAQGLSLKQQQMQQAQKQRADQSLAEAAQQLANELGKEWNAETRANLKKVGAEYGYTDEELGSVTDPRAVKVLLDAMKWRKLQADKVSTTKKLADAPKLAKPGAKPQTGSNPQKAKLQKMLRTSESRTTREKAAMALLDDYVR